MNGVRNLFVSVGKRGIISGMIGVWRSWLARALWEREVEGSSPFTPTMQ